LHNSTAEQPTRRTQNAKKKFLAAGALPWTPLGKLTALCKPPSWWGSGGKPLSKSPGVQAQQFGLPISAVWASPRPRNVDFVPTPLPGPITFTFSSPKIFLAATF